MPTKFWVGQMRFVINTREAANEKPHCHVYTGHGKGKKDAKIWLGNLRAAYWGDYSSREKKDIKLIVKGAQRKLLADWAEIHGAPQKRTKPRKS